jgi:endonuclease III
MAKKPATPAGNVTTLNALVRSAKAAAKGAESPEPLDPASQLIVSFLTWNANTKLAEQAHAKLMTELVDNHDLRVSHAHELVTLIGEDYPAAYERCLRMKECLHEIYLREFDLVPKSIGNKGKKEQKAYWESLPGVAPYVSSRVILLCYELPAMPVDDKLCALLVAEGVFSEDVSPAEAEKFILANIKPEQALEIHTALQHWCDKRKLGSRPTTPKKKVARTSKKVAKKK